MSSKRNKLLSTFLKKFDIFVSIAKISNFITLSQTDFKLIVIPVSTSIACGPTLTHKTLSEIITNENIKIEKKLRTRTHTKKSFDKIYGKYLPENVLDKKNLILLEHFYKFSFRYKCKRI